MTFKLDRASTERNGVGGLESESGSIHPSGLAVRNVEPITDGKGLARVRALQIEQ
jgi:hypothetical protein